MFLHRLFALLLICLLPLAPLWAAPKAMQAAMPVAMQQPAMPMAAGDDMHCAGHAAAMPPAGEHCSTDCILHCALPGQGVTLAQPVWIATAQPAAAGRHYSNPDPIIPLRPPAA